MNEANTFLTDLIIGAEYCLENSERLLSDSQSLYDKRSSANSFLFLQLSLEELAKGFKLMEKQSESKTFSRKEWELFSRSGKAHRLKLEYLQVARDGFAAESLKEVGVRLDELLEKMATRRGYRNYEEYRKKVAGVLFDFRLRNLYVDYDFGKRCWTKPYQIMIEQVRREILFARKDIETLKTMIRKAKERAKSF